ncbi:hypothetical protein SBA4_3530014 [Candidatus Sulfopaludibacter sp. SbA4]|nr:hypothetical protein SBA4_3530014 [Candidatus Sulfopaludibacter sp. SbA4]
MIRHVHDVSDAVFDIPSRDGQANSLRRHHEIHVPVSWETICGGRHPLPRARTAPAL